jgi:CheY-like chemotaxis protein
MQTICSELTLANTLAETPRDVKRKPMPAKPRALIADDDKNDRTMIEEILKDKFECLHAESVEEAMRCLRFDHVHFAIVDLFFAPNGEASYGLQLVKDFPHIPIVLVSGMENPRVNAALETLHGRTMRPINKNDFDIEHPETLIDGYEEQLSKIYNRVAFTFDDESSWSSIAENFVNKLGSADWQVERDHIVYELKDLARKTFCEWDADDAPSSIRASEFRVLPIKGSGDSSAVLRVRPLCANGDEQADVILKITLTSHDEHNRYKFYRNVIGGFGLGERMYRRTCHFHGQIYVVPYFRYDDTLTFSDFFERQNGEDGLKNISSVTRYLFDRALQNLNSYSPTQRNTLDLREYYLMRIKGERRMEAIKTDLTPQNAPGAVEMASDLSEFQINGFNRMLMNPAFRALREGNYRLADEKVHMTLRHGDLHAANVVVDEKRGVCWFIDYEHFDTQHFALVDHVELEASILFRSIRLDNSYDAFAHLVDAISNPDELRAFNDKAIARATRNENDAREINKALAAIRVIRDSTAAINAGDSPLSYYHALMFEALRVAGKARGNVPKSQRWRAFIAAAILFEKIQ